MIERIARYDFEVVPRLLALPNLWRFTFGTVAACSMLSFATLALAEEPSVAEKMLQGAPCRAWSTMLRNNWSGQGRDRAIVEQWTIHFARQYAKDTVARQKQDTPDKNWSDGADVDDDRVIGWLSDFCERHPDDPVIKAVFMLTMAYSLVPDHSQIPVP